MLSILTKRIALILLTVGISAGCHSNEDEPTRFYRQHKDATAKFARFDGVLFEPRGNYHVVTYTGIRCLVQPVDDSLTVLDDSSLVLVAEHLHTSKDEARRRVLDLYAAFDSLGVVALYGGPGEIEFVFPHDLILVYVPDSTFDIDVLRSELFPHSYKLKQRYDAHWFSVENAK